MNRIVVTPAGRERYLRVLLQHLVNCKDEFDRWDVWLNTTNEDDIKYIHSLTEKYDWVNVKPPTVPVNGNASIGSFFKDYVNPAEVYVRLDDDIVLVGKGSLRKLFDAREADTSSFLLYGNIINNSVITHLNQRLGNLDFSYGKAGYSCLCDTGWRDSIFAENLHRDFLRRYASGQKFAIADWVLYDFERVSINVISWRGDEFMKFSGQVGLDEEQWLSVDKPRSLGSVNRIIGDTLFVHYAFYTQRDHLDATDILGKYETLASI